MVANVLALGILFFWVNAVDSKCHYCAYVAKNCTDSENGQPVCDLNGLIQQDDVFCESENCDCSEGFSCVSLEVGCENIMLHKSNRRCISQRSLDFRFERCAAFITPRPTEPNMDDSWVNFHSIDGCTSDDCIATRQFVQCHDIECGHMIAAWKVNSPLEYHFVVDGSRAKDMAPGEFHYTVPWNEGNKSVDCTNVKNEIIENCYNLQSRNSPDGRCIGSYLEKDPLASTESYRVSELNWTAFYAVIASAGSALVALAIALVFIWRSKRSNNEDEEDDFVDVDGETELAVNDVVDPMSPLRKRVNSSNDEHRKDVV